MACGNRLRVGVHAKNTSVSGFACRPYPQVLCSVHLINAVKTVIYTYMSMPKRKMRQICAQRLRTPRPARETGDSLTHNFHEQYKKKLPPGRNSGTSRKYPEKHFWFFRGIVGFLWGAFSGSQEFRAGRLFFGVLLRWKFHVRPSWGSPRAFFRHKDPSVVKALRHWWPS